MSIGNKDRKKKTFIQKFFSRERDGHNMIKRSMTSDSFEVGEAESALVYPSSTTEGSSMVPGQQTQSHRVFVATWNAGGISPHNGLNLDDFLQVQNPSDIYVLGFQEIVPLNAGNVLVIEDNEPAAKWLSMVNQSLNKAALNKAPRRTNSVGFFTKPSLRKVSKSFRTEKKKRLKSCNCGAAELERKQSREFCWSLQQREGPDSEASSEEDDEASSSGYYATNAAHMKYGLVASKQMVGIFVTIWMRTHLVQHLSHLRISCISRGIMGCLGNKGCISVSFQLQHTSFCFVCSHLASGEKEGDELRRNLDVIEILKNTQFPKICKNPYSKIPEKILDHDRIIWFGDLNYRISLSYSDTRKLLEAKDWDALFNNDQLKIEREAGRVFKGWKEGKIYFAPTYKYSYNSDIYAGELHKSKSKRRTPAWCDRILWHGNGIQQLLYWRGESRFSDHRPVLATFLVDVVTNRNGLNKVSSRANMKIEIEELLPNKLCF